MPTINQLLKKQRRNKQNILNKTPALEKCPQKKGVCLKVYITSPKKPNSAKRKVANVRLSNKKKVMVHIPGEGHKLNQYSVVLIRGGRLQDVPGIKYKTIRGKFDLKGVANRSQARSKYGVKNWVKK